MKRSMKGLALAGAAALVLGMPSCGNKSIDTAVLADNHWVLSTMNGTDAKSLFEGPMPTMDFNFADSIVYGTSGCNRYSGGFRMDDGKLLAPHMASTRMACPFKNAESEFLMAFGDETGVGISLEKGNVLKIKGKDTVLEFVIDNNAEDEK